MSAKWGLASFRLPKSLSLHTFIQDNLVSKDFDVKFSIRKKTIQNVSTGFASGLDIESADTNDTQRGRSCCTVVRNWSSQVLAKVDKPSSFSL